MTTGLHIFRTTFSAPFSPEVEAAHLAIMPLQFRNAMARYLRWQDRQATLCGRLLLAHALALWDRCSWFDMLHAVELTPVGKPYIPGGPEFSIAHSGEVVLLAMVDKGCVGIDVEKIRPIQLNDFARYFPELVDSAQSTVTDRLALFYDQWTVREAVLKGDGSGIGALEQVRWEGGGATVGNSNWNVLRVPCGSGYCGHVASTEYFPACRIDEVHF